MFKFCIVLTLSLFELSLHSTLLYAQSGIPVRSKAGWNRGVNFGNMLDAPSEGEWGPKIEDNFFNKVVEAGMDHIRLPVSWTHHAMLEAPYTIDPVFMARVEWAVNQATARKLRVIVNNHHYDALNANPINEWQRAIAIWEQIAKHFQSNKGQISFEILNEPHGVFNDIPELWNLFVQDALAVIRKTNPTRTVLVGPVQWNSAEALSSLVLPADANLVGTIHFYEPFAFTHQGASWFTPFQPLGVNWNPTSYVIASPWNNWSWDTTLNSAVDGIQVTYNKGWAGLYVHNNDGTKGATALELNVNKQMKLKILVGNDTQSDEYFLDTTAGSRKYTIKLKTQSLPITDIFFQNYSATPVGPFRVGSMALVVAKGKREQIIKTSQAASFDSLAKAADWSNTYKVPLYLGEFGVYEAADMNSRLNWTKTIRSQAEQLNISWGYWELAGDFGFYDPENDEWRLSLIKSLVPSFRPARR